MKHAREHARSGPHRIRQAARLGWSLSSSSSSASAVFGSTAGAVGCGGGGFGVDASVSASVPASFAWVVDSVALCVVV
jgi:hypothetical protein